MHTPFYVLKACPLSSFKKDRKEETVLTNLQEIPSTADIAQYLSKMFPSSLVVITTDQDLKETTGSKSKVGYDTFDISYHVAPFTVFLVKSESETVAVYLSQDFLQKTLNEEHKDEH